MRALNAMTKLSTNSNLTNKFCFALKLLAKLLSFDNLSPPYSSHKNICYSVRIKDSILK